MDSDLSKEVPQFFQHMVQQLLRLLSKRNISRPALIGIRTGGVWIAEQLAKALPIICDHGTLDISFYRDDFSQQGLHPQVLPSELSFSTENRHLILVDDVLMSGRTARAALNELFDYGRPKSVIFCVLFDLQAYELPIQADVVGHRLQLPAGHRVKVLGPDPLSAEIIRTRVESV